MTLESIEKTSIPSGWEVELLVVDNGSTDHTRSTICAFQLRNMALRCIVESRAGLCYARNTGLLETTGEIIVFTDDDVRVPEFWLGALCQPILDNSADAVAGGVVFPARVAAALSEPPLASRRMCFASTEDLDRNRPTSMVGANMAFHRRVLCRVPGFDVELGSGALGFGDETLFSWRLRAEGYQLVGAFHAAVEHHFDATRLSGENLIKLARKIGRTDAYLFHHWEHKKVRWIFPKILRYRFALHRRIVFSWFQNKPAQRFLVDIFPLEQRLAFYAEYLVQRRRSHKYKSTGSVAL